MKTTSCCNSMPIQHLWQRFRFPFTLQVEFVLSGALLNVSYRVSNVGTEVMPFTLGSHPAFRFTPKLEAMTTTMSNFRVASVWTSIPSMDRCSATPLSRLLSTTAASCHFIPTRSIAMRSSSRIFARMQSLLSIAPRPAGTCDYRRRSSSWHLGETRWAVRLHRTLVWIRGSRVDDRAA